MAISHVLIQVSKFLNFLFLFMTKTPVLRFSYNVLLVWCTFFSYFPSTNCYGLNTFQSILWFLFLLFWRLSKNLTSMIFSSLPSLSFLVSTSICIFLCCYPTSSVHNASKFSCFMYLNQFDSALLFLFFFSLISWKYYSRLFFTEGLPEVSIFPLF